MNIPEIQAKLFESLQDCSFYEDMKNKLHSEISADTSFFNEMDVESIQLLEFILHVEKHINCSIDFDKLAIEDFDTINKLSASLMQLIW